MSFTPEEIIISEKEPKITCLLILKQLKRTIYYIKLWINGLSVPGNKMSRYHQGKSSMSATASQGEEVQQLLNTSYTNIATAKLKQYELVEIMHWQFVERILKHSYERLKRKCSSHGKYSIAKDALRKALEIEPKNKTVRKALQNAIESKLYPEKDHFRNNIAKNVKKSGGMC
ncbi:hypothetical protein THRCLA_20958 [Thraustotheca clavata]|uniref:Uncharacterized protein n=1 Tax=Thraustotheca clavata TaxID=74557 RepID=A0A1W0A294_9STRA|nr:hypothetical protein THRCLA_20958 [Thraustotheca clavata]